MATYCSLRKVDDDLSPRTSPERRSSHISGDRSEWLAVRLDRMDSQASHAFTYSTSEAKNKLCELLLLAENGVAIVITRNRKAIAKLVPFRSQPEEEGSNVTHQK
jgi:hypothetical protein